MAVVRALKLRAPTRAAIEELAAEAGVDFETEASRLLEEAIRLRRCPGIVFTVGPTGRRAIVAGSGIDVWEVAANHRAVGGDEDRLRKALHWLTEPQRRPSLRARSR